MPQCAICTKSLCEQTDRQTKFSWFYGGVFGINTTFLLLLLFSVHNPQVNFCPKCHITPLTPSSYPNAYN